MVCANALLRPNIREHSALIEKSSPHRKSSRRITGKSESTPLRFDEVFQQTARPSRMSRVTNMWFRKPLPTPQSRPCAVSGQGASGVASVNRAPKRQAKHPRCVVELARTRAKVLLPGGDDRLRAIAW